MVGETSGKSDFKRQIAYKCSIADLNSGAFVRKQGWESSYMMTEHGDFSRVNIVAVIVGKEDNTTTIDDGTGTISARVFDNTSLLSHVNVGDLVLVVGRPREFNNTIYITIEIIKKIDRKWINYRKKELSLIKKIRTMESVKVEQKAVPVEATQSLATSSSKEHMIKLIKELDNGSGAPIDDVIRLAKVKNGEDIIEDMLLKGEIFEIKAGRVKMM
jgi:RPA family protein